MGGRRGSGAGVKGKGGGLREGEWEGRRRIERIPMKHKPKSQGSLLKGLDGGLGYIHL